MSLANVTELARAETEASVRTLVELRDNVKTPPSVRCDAAEALLDRAWGKPAKAVLYAITGVEGGFLEGGMTALLIAGTAQRSQLRR